MRAVAVSLARAIRQRRRSSSSAATSTPPSLSQLPAAPEMLERRLVMAVTVPAGAELPDLPRTTGDADDAIDLRSVFVDPNAYVRFVTELGAFDVELRNDLFPAGGGPDVNPVANFLAYVRSDAYDNTILHNVGPGALAQGGEYNPSFDRIPERNPLPFPGATVPNTRGTLALPRPGASVDGGASGWFFNLGDNAALDGENGGYTVFGRVLGDGAAGNGGLTVLDDISNVPAFDLPAPFQNLPVQGPYTTGDPIGYDQTVTVTDVRELPVYPVDGEQSVLRFTASSSNPQIVNFTVDGAGLVLRYPGQAGDADITVSVLDRAGNVIATDTFRVNVADLGAPDPGFGRGGEAFPSFQGEDTIDVVTDVATDAEGRIVVVGSNLVEGDDRFAIARINPDGTPDRTFNTQMGGEPGEPPVVTGGGIVNLSLAFAGLSTDELATAVEVLPDGTILFCGFSEIDLDRDGVAERSDLVIGRIDPLGFFDPSFGDADPADPSGTRLGYVQTDLTSMLDPARPTRDRANGMTILPDGRIIVVGSSDAGDDGTDDMLIARFTSDGRLDGTFGSGGARLVPFGRAPGDPPVRSRDRANAVTLQGDGKIIAVGSLRRESDGFSGFAIVRLTPDGNLDTTFGPNGDGKFGFDAMPVMPALRVTSNEAFAVKIQPVDGRIVIGGTSAFVPIASTNPRADLKSDFGLVRLNPDGTSDASFANGGRRTSDFGGLESLSDLFIQSDATIVATGKTSQTLGGADTTSRVVVAAYRPDGSLDTDFGTAGRQVVFTDTPAGSSSTGGTSLSGGTSARIADATDGREPVAAGNAASELAALFDQLVREKQGVIDSTPGGNLVITGAQDRIVQVAVLQSDADQPAVFIQFDEVTANGVPSSTFDLTIVDDVGVDFESIRDLPLEVRVLLGELDFTGASFTFVSLKVPTGLRNPDGKPVLVDASSNASLLVARYTFVPPGGSWDAAENGEYDLAIVADEIRDVSGRFAAGAKFDNKLDVAISAPPDPPTAILQPKPPLNVPGQTEFRFTVVYNAAGAAADPQARIDAATVGVADVIVMSTDGTSVLDVTRVEIAEPKANQLRVDYVIAKRDRTAFSPADSQRQYKVTLQADAVRDVRGRPVARAELNGVVTLAVPSVQSLPDPGPIAAAVVQGLTGGAGATAAMTFTVSYRDPNGGAVDRATIDNNDVRVVAPGGTSYATRLVSTSPAAGSAETIVATYEFAAPAGAAGFRTSDNGTYALALQPEQVKDLNGNAAVASQLRQFVINLTELPSTGPDYMPAVSGLKGSAFIPGAKGKATIAVQNVGDGMTVEHTVAVRLVLRPDGGGADVDVPGTDRLVTFKAPKAVKPGRTPKPAKPPKAMKVSFLFPDVAVLGGYSLAAKVDPDGAVLERGPDGESNNVAGLPVSIDKPDLAIGQVAPGSYTLGKKTRFLVPVSNQSTVPPAKGAKGTLRLVAVPEGGGAEIVLLDGKTLAVKAGRSVKLTANTQLVLAGTYRIRVELTGVADKDAANNTSLSEPVQLVL